jgi:hypothetical protein
LKSLIVSLFVLAVMACGASINGTANSSASDPCKGHLQCPRGCCEWANQDGYGFDCVALDEQRAGICVPVTVVNPGMLGDGADAGSGALVPTTASPAPEPSEPPPVRHDGQG